MNKDKIEAGDLVVLVADHQQYYGIGLAVGTSNSSGSLVSMGLVDVYWFKLKRNGKFFGDHLTKLEAK